MDFLINGAGGNHPKATTSKDVPFFDLPEDAVRFVFDLNFMGTFLASQVFGKIMAEQGEGVILKHRLDERHPSTYARSGIFGSQSRGGQFYAMACRLHGPGVFTQDPRGRHRPGLLPH